MNPIDALMTIPSKGINAIGVLLSTGMIAGTSGFVYMHAQSNADAVEHARLEYASSIDELETESSIGIQLRKQVQSFQQMVETQPTLHSASDYNQRSADLAASAEVAEIRIDTLQPDEQRTEGLVSWIPITCAGEGSVDALMQWIEELETKWPDLVVQSLEIDSAQSSGGVRLSVLFRWYVLAERTS